MARGNRSVFSPIIILILLVIVVALYAFYKVPNNGKGLSFDKVAKEELTPMVKEIIKDNPEIIISSLEGYQHKKLKEMEAKSKETIQNKRNELHNSSSTPYAGNARGDITIVEFFDYNCKYCKSVNKILEQLMDSDKNVKIVFKELPVLAQSKRVAEAALAVYTIDPSKFLDFHNALMNSDVIDDQLIKQVAQNLSIDNAKLEQTMQGITVADELNKVHELANQIGIRGTPAFVIEDELIPGAIDLATLKQKIAEIRSRRIKGN